MAREPLVAELEILELSRFADRVLTWASDPNDEERNGKRMAAMQFFAGLGPSFGVEVRHGVAYVRVAVTKNWRSTGTGEVCAGIYYMKVSVPDTSTQTRAKQMAIMALDAALDHTKPGSAEKLRLMPICAIPAMVADMMKVDSGDKFYATLSRNADGSPSL